MNFRGRAVDQTRKLMLEQLPEQMPVLGRGSHRRAEDGACVMEYVSILAGQRFTDHPRCTHPAVATLARLVNDRLDSPERRERLALLAPDLVAIGGRDRRVTLRVVEGCLQSAALVTGRPTKNLRRELNSVRAQLRALDSTGGANLRSRVKTLPHAISPNGRVHLAFMAFTEHARGLPVEQRDILLVDLINTVVERCRSRPPLGSPGRHLSDA
jgi:hypothetical protein